MNTYKINSFSNKDELANSTAKQISDEIQQILAVKERAQIALSGGTTPSNAYKILAKYDLPWHRVDIFLGDERWVDSTHESSNALMLKKTLLSESPGSKACFHPTLTNKLDTPEENSTEFQTLLKSICHGHPPVFDLILLGLGEDGHTASLFPYSDALSITDRYVAVGYGKGQARITLTAPVICAAKKIIFLVSGSSKKTALKRLIDPMEPPERTPAKLVKTSNQILVLVDVDAASLL